MAGEQLLDTSISQQLECSLTYAIFLYIPLSKRRLLVLADCSENQDLQKAVCRVAYALATEVKTGAADKNFYQNRLPFWLLEFATKSWHDVHSTAKLQARSNLVVATFKLLENLRMKMSRFKAECKGAVTFSVITGSLLCPCT